MGTASETEFESLFSRWKQKCTFNAFIKDGIVCPESYATPHILFVLRDMNCHEARDLRDDLRSHGSGWKTWNNIGRWASALLDGTDKYPSDMTEPRRVEQLRRIAVLNLKKEGGGSRTSGKELAQAVCSQREEILTEIEMCDPKLVICCGLTGAGIKGNAVLLKEEVFTETSDWRSFSSELAGHKWWYYIARLNGIEVPVVSFCHPQVTNLCGKRGHSDLFQPLYRDMLTIGNIFLKQQPER